MDQEYLYKCRRKIKNISEENKEIEVTERKVQLWFNVLNKVIFKNKLPKFGTIQIMDSKHFHAMCECEDDEYKLVINPSFENKKRFIEVMAHEMIHLYEWINYERMGHGKRFFMWKDELAKYQLKLYKAY